MNRIMHWVSVAFLCAVWFFVGVSCVPRCHAEGFTPVELGASIDGLTTSGVEVLVYEVRSAGYSCGSISDARTTGYGYRLACDNNAKVYWVCHENGVIFVYDATNDPDR